MRASCVQSSVLGRGCRDLKTDHLGTHRQGLQGSQD